MQINVYQEGTKINTEVNVDLWRVLKRYALEYKAPLISMYTNILQPSLTFVYTVVQRFYIVHFKYCWS